MYEVPGVGNITEEEWIGVLKMLAGARRIRNRRIMEMKQSGMTIPEIADMMHVDISRVCDILIEEGYSP